MVATPIDETIKTEWNGWDILVWHMRGELKPWRARAMPHDKITDPLLCDDAHSWPEVIENMKARIDTLGS